MIKIFIDEYPGQPFEHHYNLYVDNDNCKLEYIKSEDPSFNTTDTLIDDGDGLHIDVGSKSFSLEYDEALQLLIMLLQNNTTKLNFVENKITKSI